MAAKGTIAKDNVAKKLAEVFGADYIGEYDKKYYLWANDGGERVQIAISMTCPKNPIVVDELATDDGGDWDFSDTPKSKQVAVAPVEPAEITEEEKARVADLLAKFGL